MPESPLQHNSPTPSHLRFVRRFLFSSRARAYVNEIVVWRVANA